MCNHALKSFAMAIKMCHILVQLLLTSVPGDSQTFSFVALLQNIKVDQKAEHESFLSMAVS
jgi:hypothetical protein